MIAFGAQYHRAPTPVETAWESDLDSMVSYGFNAVKYWAQWRWSNPAEDEFYFDDLDRLMDLAAAKGLRVIINTIFDCAPAWLYKAYPDSVMLDAKGRQVGPAVLSHRQIGGAPGPCFHHPQAQEHLVRFLTETVRRYAAHPAMWMWDVWNEPELTCGMQRLERFDDLVCYCGHSKNAFVGWLQKKYGTIAGLNQVWHRNYRSWSEIELPVTGQTFSDMIDWRRFFMDTMEEQLRLRAGIVKEWDRLHPVMCHTVPSFPLSTCGADNFAMAEPCDIFGSTSGQDPFATDLIVSAAKGRLVVNSEVHALPGDTFHRPSPPDFDDLSRFLLAPLAQGVRGFLFWQYRPESLGLEGPAWGLTRPDGKPTQWLEDASKIGHFMTAYEAVLEKGRRPKPTVGIVYSPNSELFTFCGLGTSEPYLSSLRGWHTALYGANYDIALIHEERFTIEELYGLKTLILPLACCLKADFAAALQDWVREGGILIAESYLGQLDSSSGLLNSILPGMGLDSLLGVHEVSGLPENREDGLINVGYLMPDGYSSDGMVFLKPRFISSGYELLEDSVEVLGRRVDGLPSITCRNVGKGKAVMIGTVLGLAIPWADPALQTAKALLGMGSEPDRRAVGMADGAVRIDVLKNGLNMVDVLFLQNLTENDLVKVKIDLGPDTSGTAVRLHDPFAGDDFDMLNGQCQIPLLRAKSVRVFVRKD